MTETCLLEIVHGSRLYGTVHGDSDLDLKSVWLPSAQDILLGATDWTINDTNGHRANTRDDVDHERMDLLKFSRLLAAGQPSCIEMLFAPEDNHRVSAHPVFATFGDNLDLSVPCKPNRFLTYIEAQAPAFGVRSARAEVAERAAQHLEALGLNLDDLTVGEVADRLVSALGSRFVTTGMSKPSPAGSRQPLLYLCGKALAFGARARLAADAARRISEQPDAVTVATAEKDWTSVYHAVRFGYEALEFYRTGYIEFPRPGVPRLMDIRFGRVPEDEVADEMRMLLEAVPRAADDSSLRKDADVEFLNECVMTVYGEKVATRFMPEVPLDAFVASGKRDV